MTIKTTLKSVSQKSESPVSIKKMKRSKSRLAEEAKRTLKRRHVDIFLVSELTGGLARHITSVALAQFAKLSYQLHEYPLCANANELRLARHAISQAEAPLVFSALTQRRLKRTLASWCDRNDIDHFDLMDSIVDFVSQRTLHRPIHNAARTHRCDREYYKRIDAWEYTLQHDDSRRLETIGQSDLILLGVSRVGKTPLAAYMGSLGYRVANVSISYRCQIPSQVGDHREKTIGLTIDPDRLSDLRERRFEQNGLKGAIRKIQGNDSEYFSSETAVKDVLFAEEQFRKLGIRKLDITDSTIEETTARILKSLDLHSLH